MVMPAAVAAQAGSKIGAPTTTMANGDMATVAGISIQALPMYNVEHGPRPGRGVPSEGPRQWIHSDVRWKAPVFHGRYGVHP